MFAVLFFANVILSSITLGLVISLVNIKTNKKEGYLPSFPITLIMLLVIISIIILLVGNNVARAFSLAGAFSLILCGVMIVLFLTNFAMSKTKNMQLKIIVPEDLNYEGVFEEVLDVYTTTFHIERVKLEILELY